MDKTPGQIAREEFNGAPVDDCAWNKQPFVEERWERAAAAVIAYVRPQLFECIKKMERELAAANKRNEELADSCKEMNAALSRCAYFSGPPNEQECSWYDVEPYPQSAVDAVRKMRQELDAANKRADEAEEIVNFVRALLAAGNVISARDPSVPVLVRIDEKTVNGHLHIVHKDEMERDAAELGRATNIEQFSFEFSLAYDAWRRELIDASDDGSPRASLSGDFLFRKFLDEISAMPHRKRHTNHCENHGATKRL